MENTPTAGSQAGQDRVAAFVAALIFFAPVFMKVKTEFVMFYARQSFVLFLISACLTIIGTFVPFISLLNYVVVATNIWCAIQAYQGSKFAVPIIADQVNMIIEKL